MNYSKIFGWILFVVFIVMILLSIVLAIIISVSISSTPHTYCSPGFAASDSERYGDCFPCGMNRYSATGIFCYDCPIGTYTCTNIADSIYKCIDCQNVTFNENINNSICSSC